MIQPKMAALPAALFFFFSSIAFAGTFDNPTNLKVLPENISPDELGQIMRGFAMGTGNRCSACHVGEVEADLSTYDFSLDDKENKNKARTMIQLVADINNSLANAFPGSTDLVQVTCATCHRGQPKPLMIEDVLTATLNDEGIDQTVARYRELRERYYGSYTFDFSECMLMGFTEQGDLDGARRDYGTALEMEPNSGWIREQLDKLN